MLGTQTAKRFLPPVVCRAIVLTFKKQTHELEMCLHPSFTNSQDNNFS